MSLLNESFVRAVRLREDKIGSFDRYPFSIPAIRNLGELEIGPKVTAFLGENGSGKSTLLEAIAVAAGGNPPGGAVKFTVSTRKSGTEVLGGVRLGGGN